MTKQNGFNIMQKVETEPTVHEFYVYDDITTAPHIDWERLTIEESKTSAEYFRKQLEAIPEDDEIRVYINSCGGEAYEAIAIANQLKRHRYVTGIVDGMCHSAAFNILQGCSRRVMNKGTSAIIHNMWTVACGNASQLREAADQLEAAMASCRQMYLERANIDEQTLIELLDRETNLTPETALEMGFIDEIGEAAKQEAEPEPAAEAESAEVAVPAEKPAPAQKDSPKQMKQGGGFNRLFS